MYNIINLSYLLYTFFPLLFKAAQTYSCIAVAFTTAETTNIRRERQIHRVV